MKIKATIKNILKVFFLYNSLISINYAEADKIYCAPPKTYESLKVKVNDFPGYFFSVHPSGEYIAYIGLKNTLLNLKNGKKYPLPGNIDPVFSPDGKYLVVPAKINDLSNKEIFYNPETHYEKEFMNFYKIDTVLDNLNSNSETFKKLHPALVDKENESNYQSISITQNNKMSLLTDHDGASLKEYQIDKNKIFPVGGYKKLCAQNNKGHNFDLPMLSKDGKFLSILNNETKTTQIYDISKKDSCLLSADLGVATGKVSFNWDSTQITFHIDGFSQNMNEHFSGVQDDMIKNVYVVNLEKKETKEKISLTPTTWAKITSHRQSGTGSYYPTFSQNNDIFFLSDKNNYFEFSKVEQKNLNFMPFLNLSFLSHAKNSNPINSACFNLGPSIKASLALGQLYNTICEALEKPSLNDTLLLSMELERENCKELVKKYWIDQAIHKKMGLNFLNEISMDDLLNACPDTKSKEISSKTIGTWKKRDNADFKKIIQRKCMRCHTQNISFYKNKVLRKYYDENANEIRVDKERKKIIFPAINPDNPDILRILSSIVNPNPNKRMPKGGKLTKKEFEQLFLYAYTTTRAQQQGLVLSNDEDLILRGTIFSDEALNKKLEEYSKTIQTSWWGLFTTNKEKNILAAQKKREKRKIWCEYGQQGCQELIEDMTKEKKIELLKEDPKIKNIKLKKDLDSYRLELQCHFVFEATYKKCLPIGVED